MPIPETKLELLGHKLKASGEGVDYVCKRRIVASIISLLPFDWSPLFDVPSRETRMGQRDKGG